MIDQGSQEDPPGCRGRKAVFFEGGHGQAQKARPKEGHANQVGDAR